MPPLDVSNGGGGGFSHTILHIQPMCYRLECRQGIRTATLPDLGQRPTSVINIPSLLGNGQQV